MCAGNEMAGSDLAYISRLWMRRTARLSSGPHLVNSANACGLAMPKTDSRWWCQTAQGLKTKQTTGHGFTFQLLAA